MQAEGPADASTLASIYTEQFHATSQQRADLAPGDLSGEKARKYPVLRNAERRTQWLQSQGFTGRLLDVGAGRGYFVKAAATHFDACGIELSAVAVSRAINLGAEVRQGDFMCSDFGDRCFDVITMWDVLAGFRDPQAVVGRLRSMQQPGGVLVFTVPLADSIIAKLLGRFWPLLIPPVNLSYFTVDSLRVLLDSHGYTPVAMHRQGKHVALDFILLKALRTLRLSKAEQLAERIPPGVAVYVNLRDILTVVARVSCDRSAPARGIDPQ